MSSTRIPQHVAIIMDGNGRWAERRHRPRVHGHIRGARRVKDTVIAAQSMGVKVLTLFAFSTENWSRPSGELQVLWKVLAKFLKREIDELDRNGVRFRVIGELERLDPSVQALVRKSVERLDKNRGLELVLAISYGSQAEIVRATRLFAEDVSKGLRKPEDMSVELMEQYLWTRILGERSKVDLLIRTSGERRISNFLLWQSAYAELVFVEESWPDFSADILASALSEYGNRERRFGGVITAAEKAALSPAAATAGVGVKAFA